MVQLTQDHIHVLQLESYGKAFHNPNVLSVAQHLAQCSHELIAEPKPRSEKWISTSVPEDKWDTDLAKWCSPQYFSNNMVSPVLFYETLQHVPRNATVV